MISGDDYSDIDLSGGGLSLFAIDPGETTGWAWVCLGRKEIDGFSSGNRLSINRVFDSRSGFLRGDKRMESGEVNSNVWRSEGRVVAEITAAYDIMVEMIRCKHQGDRVSKERASFLIVIEDFVLRQHSASRSLLAPVRLSTLIEAMVYGNQELNCPIILQSPSDAKGTLTDQRMKDAGLWLPGYPHATDAFRHLLLCLRRLLPLYGSDVPKRQRVRDRL